jgi:hypothetical protein
MLWFDGHEKAAAVGAANCPNRVEGTQHYAVSPRKLLGAYSSAKYLSRLR